MEGYLQGKSDAYRDVATALGDAVVPGELIVGAVSRLRQRAVTAEYLVRDNEARARAALGALNDPERSVPDLVSGLVPVRLRVLGDAARLRLRRVSPRDCGCTACRDREAWQAK
jgi:hypothetical protein